MTAWSTLLPIALFFGSAYSHSTATVSGATCSLSNATLPVPANQTQLIAPDHAPSFIGLGVGVQNYTCNTTSSTYVSEGAVAELFDVACLYENPLFRVTPALAYLIWEGSGNDTTAQDVIDALDLDLTALGHHFFIHNPTGSGLSPEWDFTSSIGNPNAYVIGAKAGDLPSSNPSVNVDDLMIKAIEGDLADLVFRVQNHGGQPPKSCTQSNITVKYVAVYWFYGGNITQSCSE